MADAADNGGEMMSGDGMGSDVLSMLTNARYLVAGWIVVLIAGAAFYWFGAWVLQDSMPSFERLLGQTLAQASNGLFIASGFLGAFVLLGLVRTLEQRIAAHYGGGSGPSE